MVKRVGPELTSPPPSPIPSPMSDTGDKFQKLVAIMDRLRSPGGCPWDRKQHYKDIAPHTLEETHEVLRAIDRGDLDGLREELGDLMLQIVFYAQIAKEENRFDINGVIEAITEKLIHRHPHVFGEAKVNQDYQIARGGWYGDYGDPTTFLDLFVTGSGNNDCGYSNSRYDALLREAANCPAPGPLYVWDGIGGVEMFEPAPAVSATNVSFGDAQVI